MTDLNSQHENIRTFSSGSDQYARHRPRYPKELFTFLDDAAAGHDCAWDCATGNGQAAISCAEYFSHIEATDISSEQIEHCIAHPRIRYSVGTAEKTDFERHSFGLIMVAQAIHWFDREKFFREVERVLKPGGILAIFGYGFFDIDPAIDSIVCEYLLAPVDPYWAAGNRLIINGYREVFLPFDEIDLPQDFFMQVDWSLPQLLAYLRTWSAVKRFVAETGNDPVLQLEEKLRPVWREAELSKPVRMPLFVRVSRKASL